MSAIEFENVWFKYPMGKDWTLESINLKIDDGEFVAITGETGAGKSTLSYCLNGLVPHNLNGDLRGIVRVLGQDTLLCKVSDLAKNVGMTFQDPEAQLFGLTVEEEVAFGLENYGTPPDEMEKRVTWALNVVRMLEYRTKSPYELSGGQKQRVAIASSLALKPRILVMDEPTSELDPIGKDEVFSVVRRLQSEYNMTIILVEHETEEIAQYADRIILMRNGKIVKDGTPRDFFDSVDLLRECGVRAPQVSEFAYLLKSKSNWPYSIPITYEEAIANASKIINNRTSCPFSGRNDDNQGVQSTAEPIIRVENVSYTYDDGTHALKNVNLEIRKGEYASIIGQNGSGKTTLVKHFNGLLRPTKGRILIKGVDAKSKTVAELSRDVGYAFQNPDHQIFSDTVENEIRIGPKNLGFSPERTERVLDESLSLLKLNHLRKEHPLFTSRGERKAISIASILAMEPEVLILDEPSTGQDWNNSVHVLEIAEELHRRGKTIVIITHDMRLVAERSRRTIVMKQGEILLDLPTREVFARPDILEESFIKPPQIATLSQQLVSETALTPKEFADALFKDSTHILDTEAKL